MDLKGQLSHPRPKIETLAPQGSRVDLRSQRGPGNRSDRAVRESESDLGEEEGRLSNPPVRQVQRRLKPDDINRLLAAYLSGDLIRDLAARFGVSPTTVIGHVSRNGLPRRGDSGWSDAEFREAADLYAGGASLATVGHRFGLDASTVRNRFRVAGVRVRPRRGWG